MRRATDASIDAMKDLVAPMGPIRPGTQAGMLTRSEFGWLASTSVWAWILTRAEQATTEGWNTEHAIRTTRLIPDPWLVGAIRTVLPKLLEACPDLDYTKPVGEWSKDEITEFLAAAFDLIRQAAEARDATECRVAGEPTNAGVTARRMNAAAGNPRMTVAEFDDGLPPF